MFRKLHENIVNRPICFFPQTPYPLKDPTSFRESTPNYWKIMFFLFFFSKEIKRCHKKKKVFKWHFAPKSWSKYTTVGRMYRPFFKCFLLLCKGTLLTKTQIKACTKSFWLNIPFSFLGSKRQRGSGELRLKCWIEGEVCKKSQCMSYFF